MLIFCTIFLFIIYYIYYVLYLVSTFIACSLLCGIKEVVCCFRQHGTAVVLLHAYGFGL